MTVQRPALRWHGGKWLLAPKIIAHFPAHRTYTEAFGGAASVLLRKPRTYAEVYNDLDGEVVNLFRVLQHPWRARRLREQLAMTPFARAEFELAYRPAPDPTERARRLVVRSFMGFGSNSANRVVKTGFRACSERSHTTAAHDWANYPDRMDALLARLRGIVVEQRPAPEVLLQHDRPTTLHYVDPPYVRATRSQKMRRPACYVHELTDQEHRDLARVLHGLKGMVVLSGYATPLYDRELYPDWARVEIRALADGARERTEILWLNPAAERGGRP